MSDPRPPPSAAEKARAIVAGKVIEALRLRKNWSQTDLANALNWGQTSRVGQATISRLESGNLLRPDAFLFRRLAEVFDLTPEQLHQHIDEATQKTKKMVDGKGDEWWSTLAAIALGALALYVILSMLEDGPGKGPPVPKP